jgi:sulfide:quinone oxidoreductase
MSRIVILGAGTGGTIMANKLRKALDSSWSITIIDEHRTHYYQPGFLFIPFGIYQRQDVQKSKANFIPPGVDFVLSKIEKILPKENNVLLSDGKKISYDILIVATGVRTVPSETEGLTGSLWNEQVFQFYTIEGALALEKFFKSWEGGDLVLNIADMPIKCPVAPLEFVMLADSYFVEKGIRDKVNIKFVTPLSAAFTKPISARVLGEMLKDKNIEVITDFYIEKLDNENKKIFSYDEKEVSFDCLVSIPVHKGADYLQDSDIADDMNFVRVDKHTLQSVSYDNIFALGDATNLPTSKAGSVVHFSSDILFENIMCKIEERELSAKFDGHANCYIESGQGKGVLIDFNYSTEPLPGKYPMPGIGPFGLLRQTKVNHYGKLIFRWMYWHMILKGKEMPIETLMSMAGKEKINV